MFEHKIYRIQKFQFSNSKFAEVVLGGSFDIGIVAPKVEDQVHAAKTLPNALKRRLKLDNSSNTVFAFSAVKTLLFWS